MKGKHIIILSIILISLIGIYFWQQRPVTVNEAPLFEKVLKGIDISRVDLVEVWSGQDSASSHLVLRKKEGKWFVKRQEDGSSFLAPAKEDRIERLLSSLANLKGETRARGEENMKTFALTEDKALHVTLKGGDKVIAHLIVGKRGPRWDSSFVRPLDSDKAYLASNNLLTLFDIWSEMPENSPNPRPWTNLSVIAEVGSEVEAISYEGPDKNWSLTSHRETADASNVTKSDNVTSGKSVKTKWLFSLNGKEEKKDAAEVKKFLEKLLPLYGNDVLPPSRANEVGLGPGSRYARLTFHFGRKGIKMFHIGAIDEKKKVGWLRDENGTIYEVKSDWIEQIHSPFSKKDEKKKTVSQSEGPRKD